ncbi:MAG: ATP-binding protein [Verrucomicrobiota bacterium]
MHGFSQLFTAGAGISLGLLGLGGAGGWLLSNRRFKRERHEHGLTLASKEEQLQFIYESVPIGISMYVQDRGNNRVWHINDRHLAMSGVTREEIKQDIDATLFLERTHPADRQPQELLGASIAAGKIREFDLEKRYVHRDGRVVWVSFTTMKQTLSNGEQVYLHTVTDITRLKDREEELRRAREEAEQANETQKRFVANVSHELRTHISAIIGFTDLLQASSLDADQKKYVSVLCGNAEALLRMSSEILDLSKIEARRMDLELRPFSLRACVHTAASLMGAQAKKKGLALEETVHPSVPDTFVGDEVRVRQILANLLSNAIKFTEKGAVRLHVDLSDDGRSLSHARFCVSDTGVGISADNMPKLFRAYSQGDPSVSRNFGGTGLGLAIVKGLVELMGGAIHVDSTVGEGSVFCFDIPVNLAGSGDQVDPPAKATA